MSTRHRCFRAERADAPPDSRGRVEGERALSVVLHQRGSGVGGDLPYCVSAHPQSADPVKQKQVAAEKTERADQLRPGCD